MPPSRIPEAQVQAILAELRESGAYPEPAAAAGRISTARTKHAAGMFAAIVASALMLGLAFSPLPDILWSRPEAPATPLPTPVPVQPVTQEIPAPAAAAAVRPIKVARTRPTPAKSRCLAGGPCGRADVAVAERRLRAAYRTAEKAGVERSDLAAAKVRWDAQRRRYAKSPRTSVRLLRAVAADLNRKSTLARRGQH